MLAVPPSDPVFSDLRLWGKRKFRISPQGGDIRNLSLADVWAGFPEKNQVVYVLWGVVSSRYCGLLVHGCRSLFGYFSMEGLIQSAADALNQPSLYNWHSFAAYRPVYAQTRATIP